ncbi:MAG TPA: hypothetical protein VJN63_04320 [Thermoplasmata archaeon]|nr:hypothetical protein [Thermoplasmata archaeon]
MFGPQGRQLRHVQTPILSILEDDSAHHTDDAPAAVTLVGLLSLIDLEGHSPHG